MPVVASAIASPIHNPAIVTVVSFCTTDNGSVVIVAFKFTAIAAVRRVVPIRSSIGLLPALVYLHLFYQTKPRPRRPARSLQIARSQNFQRGLAVGAQHLADLRLRLRPIGKAPPHDAPPLRGDADYARSRVVTRLDRNPFALLQQRQ